ncbi:SSI family serine proteinase inhibitor, partial [Streptomyces atacamensis]|uniref:SSI family serine proteinase inhibitor n=1 Tax=Streptomyces atacamensis TaxID=531966 RepID=UPI00399CAE33
MTGRPSPWVLGVDSGGSGLRVALARAGGGGRAAAPVPVGTASSNRPVRTGPAGIDAAHLLELVLPRARSLLAAAEPDSAAGAGSSRPRIDTVCVGAAGMATLGGELRAVDGELASLVEAGGDRMCPMVWDPVTVTADGVWEGRR